MINGSVIKRSIFKSIFWGPWRVINGQSTASFCFFSITVFTKNITVGFSRILTRIVRVDCESVVHWSTSCWTNLLLLQKIFIWSLCSPDFRNFYSKKVYSTSFAALSQNRCIQKKTSESDVHVLLLQPRSDSYSRNLHLTSMVDNQVQGGQILSHFVTLKVVIRYEELFYSSTYFVWLREHIPCVVIRSWIVGQPQDCLNMELFSKRRWRL